MTPERWERVKDALGAVLGQGREERAAFLARLRTTDSGLHDDVQRMLAHESQHSFLERPLLEHETLRTGTWLGPYQVLEPLGRGGMGDVHRAHDTKLNRDVALKVLPDAFASDAERLARFDREAQVLASLNHHNIAAIYGVEEQAAATEGERPIRALVLELVDGPTLADRIAGGPIPLHEALQIARQVADALATAHDQGIIHRDLKPANVKLRTDGTVKILDFGLAKALEPGDDPSSPAPADPANSPTLTAASQMGVVMGTAAYLSPEQARGENASKRSDIWAFGVVLLEMLTGKHPFRGPTVPETLALVLTKEPDWSILPPDTPPAIRRLLRRCLEKEPKRRLGYIGDAQLDLDEAEDELGALGSSEATTTWQRRVPTLLAAAIVSLVIGVAISNLLSPTSIVRPLTRFRLSMPEDMQFSSVGVSLSVAPDGGAVALAMSSTQIRVPVGPQHPSGFPNPARYPRMTYLFPQDQLDPHPLPGAAGANSLSFSPDGQWLLIDGGVRTLAKVPISGGRPITLHEGPIRGASWGADDTIVFGQAGKGLWRISAAGTGLEQLTHVEADESHVYPHFLSGESAALFGVWRGGMETARIDVLSLESGERRTLVEGVTPRYSATGHLLFGRDAALWAAPFDLHRLEVTGSPVQVLGDLHINTTAGAFGSAQYAVADDGSLVYAPRRLTPVETRTLVWVDRDGHEEPLTAEPRRYRYTRIAPDGTRVAVHAQDQESDIWTWDFSRETLTRLTFDPFHDTGPVWTPDGERLAFRRAPRNQNPGTARILWKAGYGTGAAELLAEWRQNLMPTSFTPDGQHLLLTEHGEDSNLYLLSIGEEPALELLLKTEFNERNAEISPDGRWLAYQSDASGQHEICVQPFPNLDSARWQLSSNGGTHPLWSHEGGELFHWTLDRNLVSVSVQTDPTFVPGDSQVIIEALGNEYLVLPDSPRSYDIHPNGQRFLLVKLGTGTEPEIVVVQDWDQELLERVPVP